MAVNLVDASFKAKRNCNKKSIKHMPGSPLALCSEARYLIIRLPNSEFIKLCYRMLILTLALASFPFLMKSSFIERISSSSTFTHQALSDSSLDQFSYDSVNMLFRDLTNEGLMKKTEQKAVFLSNNIQGETGSQVVTDYDMDIVPLNDLGKQNSVLDNTVDFIFTSNFPASSKFIERTLKTGGVVTVLMNDNPATAFYKPSNYKIVYMRRFDSIAVAMKKTGGPSAVDEKVPSFSAAPRKLCGYASEAKKAALKNLEDVLLEPPRAASGKSRKYLKRTRYLPDLMGDSLESYPRRVFIDVGLPEKDDWFRKNYPTRNKDFEIYKIETVTEEASGKEVAQIGMSDWLRKNVKEEEYVVMRAEAEVVEEMMRSNSIGLVDELFLECKPRGNNNGDRRRSRRAYWECLALYGKLRDEGVAVHQWWG